MYLSRNTDIRVSLLFRHFKAVRVVSIHIRLARYILGGMTVLNLPTERAGIQDRDTHIVLYLCGHLCRLFVWALMSSKVSSYIANRGHSL